LEFFFLATFFDTYCLFVTPNTECQ